MGDKTSVKRSVIGNNCRCDRALLEAGGGGGSSGGAASSGGTLACTAVCAEGWAFGLLHPVVGDQAHKGGIVVAVCHRLCGGCMVVWEGSRAVSHTVRVTVIGR